MNVTHDRELQIALGTGRKTKKWKNRAMRWSELLDRLSRFVVTNETVAQYRAMSRDRQAEIKDVGGFVGGYCRDGSRSDVTCRSVLCLDADYADGNLWADFQLLADCAAAVYSTHKHTPDSPRLRLVIPLARDVTPDEYAAIGRRVAADLGIEKFDDTTYEAGRLMYILRKAVEADRLPSPPSLARNHLPAGFCALGRILSGFRQAEPARTCCRAPYRRLLAAIDWSGQGLRIGAILHRLRGDIVASGGGVYLRRIRGFESMAPGFVFYPAAFFLHVKGDRDAV